MHGERSIFEQTHKKMRRFVNGGIKMLVAGK